MIINFIADRRMGFHGCVDRRGGAVTFGGAGFVVDNVTPNQEEDIRALLLHPSPLPPLRLLLHPPRWHLLLLHHAPRLLPVSRRSLPSLLAVP